LRKVVEADQWTILKDMVLLLVGYARCLFTKNNLRGC